MWNVWGIDPLVYRFGLQITKPRAPSCQFLSILIIVLITLTVAVMHGCFAGQLKRSEVYFHM
jgi:hypothetical protein